MQRILAAFLAATSCVPIAQAQIQAPEANIASRQESAQPIASASTPQNIANLTLDQALNSAGVASPNVRAAEADVEAAAAGREVARLRPNPAVSLDADNVAGTGDYGRFNALEVTAALALPIELGGKRSARLYAADAEQRRAAIASAVAMADLRLNVVQGYTEAVAAEQRFAVAQRQLRIASDAARTAEVRVEAGRASPLEVERANVERINAEIEMENASRLANVARYSLARLIGTPVDSGLDVAWFRRIDDRVGPAGALDYQDSLALAAAEADVDIADANVRLARSQRLGDLQVSAGARRLFETRDTAMLVGVSMPLPLFNRGTAAVAQASAQRQRAQWQKRAALLQAEQAIARAQADVANAARAAIAANGPALAAAEEAARIARIGYAEGKFGQLELLDAERQLAATRSAAIDATAAYHIATAQFERLTARAPEI